MRLTFFLLVLANLAFYVWSAGYLGTTMDGHEPERLGQQLAPEKIAIGEPALARPAAAAVPEIACRLVGGAAADALAALEGRLAAETDLTVSRRTEPADIQYRVLIPSLPSRAVAEKKLGEVLALGVADAAASADEASGPFIVSLGIFSTEKAATDRLAQVGKNGVRSAKVAVRERSPARLLLEVRGAGVQDRLATLLATQPGVTLADCPAAR